MKIGIEATTLLNQNPTGIAKYTLNLTKGLINLIKDKKGYDLALIFPISKYLKRKGISTSLIAPTQWYHANIYPFMRNFDVIHCTDNKFIKRHGTKTIYTVHDLAIFHEKHQFEYYTDTKFKEIIFHRLNHAVKRSDAIITVSQCTKNDLMEFFKVPDQKIFVTHLAPDHPIDSIQDPKLAAVILRKHRINTNKYFIFIGGISIRKNVLNLIRAFHQSNSSKDYKLVLAGSLSMGSQLILEEIQKLHLQDRIILTGYVADEDLPILLVNSSGLLYPTFYEGFGIPVLEGMQAKVPVLAGNRGAVPEFASGYALLVDPFSVEEISVSIDNLKTVSEENLIKAQQYASSFTWELLAQQTMKVYES